MKPYLKKLTAYLRGDDVEFIRVDRHAQDSIHDQVCGVMIYSTGR